MEQAKLTIRVEKKSLDRAKAFASRQKISLSRLVDEYLKRLPEGADVALSPIVRRISGVLSQDLTIADYHRHLDEKYHAGETRPD